MVGIQISIHTNLQNNYRNTRKIHGRKGRCCSKKYTLFKTEYPLEDIKKILSKILVFMVT